MSKSLSDFIEKYRGQKEIYIIGSGPTLRLFPTHYFRGKFTIGLNEAYKSCVFIPTVNLTIHPRLIPTNLPEHNYRWITKVKDNVDVSSYYLFNNIDDLPSLPKWHDNHGPNSLYTGRGIQTAALHLAARLNATYAILVGIDMASMAGDHHCGEGAHIQPHQFNINQVYREYYYYTSKVSEILKETYNMFTISLSPLLGECCREEDYKHQLQYNNLKPFLPPKIIETAKRTTPLVDSYL